MKIEKIPLIENRSDVTLTAYLHEPSPELLGRRKRPAVLVCPGGGYLACSDREAEPVALAFAGLGYHALVLRYSVYAGGEPGAFPLGADLLPRPACQYPNPMLDIGRAFLAIRARAEAWRADPEKIALCGFSAGGHNCAMYSVYWDKPLLAAALGGSPADFRPAASILCYAICDYRAMLRQVQGPGARQMCDASAAAYFGTATPGGDMLDTASPCLHVTENTPPTFLWATADDDLVPVENTLNMALALKSAGVPFEVHVFERGPHGLSLADWASAVVPAEVDPDAGKWFGLAGAFLRRRLPLPLREKKALPWE